MALVNETARILSNEYAGPRLHLMTLEAPQIAAYIEPGQFVHMKVPRMEAHILRRPFSVYARDVDAGSIDVLYQVVGFGTDHMTRLAAGRRHVEPARGGPLPARRRRRGSGAPVHALRADRGI